ncbi:fatty-acid amide hydrolase 2-B-like [Pogonomyrmex barbatus]|uniref:Fatty-acid amide hydrolase 2-B-like n=1 Tax=Pogonomyrmex barbatus TaxID=144034 RepID=A0A6I9VW23_9HYME|nr:fatty-acid amide hydrolase 2-B-like [Pogonomyrmex barbatus]
MIMLWKIRILFGIINIIYATAHRILLYFSKKPSSIPPITNSLYMLSASTLARKIRQGEITSYEVVQAYITRIKEVNPFLNAVVEDRFSAAIIEAKNCDEQLKAGKFDVAILEKEKPLYGVPLTVKECCAVKGCSHSGCTLPRKGMKADYDATVIELLRNAGAIPLCVTNTPELSTGIESTNLLIGRTCNPYDTRYSAGGSSGGEGALLGAGASVIGLGSDMAGSIRLPAFLNGVFGHKPTAGKWIFFNTKIISNCNSSLEFDLLGDNGVFIYPTFRNQILPDLALCELLSVSSCGIVNIFGFPAVNVPMGLNHDGMPMGIQVIAAPYQDRLCLAVAKELETAFGGWVPPSVSIRD